MDREKKIERIEYLIEKLNAASKAYYDDASEIMTNYEYDEAYDELLALEAETGYVAENSPSINVGYETKTNLPKVTHEKKMLSMNKTKDRDELKAWLGEYEGLLSWKLDGLTVVLTYENGKLKSAVTRGNGVQGELITDNALACKNVPKEIPCKQKVIVRGEAIIKYSDFEKINEEIEDADAKYKNPRNLCSGSIRQLDARITAERRVYICIFSLVNAPEIYEAEIDTNNDIGHESQWINGAQNINNSRLAQMEWMKELGFDVVEYELVNQDNLFAALDKFESRITEFDIPVDGLVLTFEDAEYSRTLGETAKYPKNAMAFKWRDQNAETTLKEIEWSPSRTGLLNPVAIFDSVELEGTTVSRASVHNINIMEDLKLGIGDKIVVYKANMIIPQISGNLTQSGKIEIPTKCPVCGGDTIIKDEEGTKTLHCLNPNCIAKNVKSFEHFVSRDALNIEGLSEAGLLKLIGAGFIKKLPDIFYIEQHKNDIVLMEGFGEKSYNNLIDSINAAKKTTPAKLLYGLGIAGIGVTTANLISRECKNSWDRIMNITEEELLQIDGIGEVLSKDFVKYFENPENRALVNEILNFLELDESFQLTGDKLNGKIFVITGSLEHYPSRKELKDAIEAEGGVVSSSVSANTSYLITNDTTSGSSKNKAAKELSIPIITEDEIIQMLSS